MLAGGSRLFSAAVALTALMAAMPGRADDAHPKGTIWSVGEDEGGCFAATNDAGMGITYSAEDRFRVFFAGGSGNATSPSPSVKISIGPISERLPLQAIGDEGWLLHESANAESIRAFVAEMMKGTSGPISIETADAGLHMVFDTQGLQFHGSSFWQCVKRQTPEG